MIIFFFMYKKHELIIGFIFWNNIFRHLRIFWKILKKMKMEESSRSLSSNKKEVKRSKLVVTANTKTVFKSEWKKEFSFITSIPNDVIASKRYNWNCSCYIIFSWYHQMYSISELLQPEFNGGNYKSLKWISRYI